MNAIGKLVRTIILLVGICILVYSWINLDQIALNRSLGYPEWVSRTEITFWYSLSAIEAGILLGSVAAFWRHSVGHTVILLTIIVWICALVNIFILALLLIGGSFLPIF
jgi:hypothetical protein